MKDHYTVVARDPNSWRESTGEHFVTWDCGHRHRTEAAAERCELKLSGGYKASGYPARMHGARVEQNPNIARA